MFISPLNTFLRAFKLLFKLLVPWTILHVLEIDWTCWDFSFFLLLRYNKHSQTNKILYFPWHPSLKTYNSHKGTMTDHVCRPRRLSPLSKSLVCTAKDREVCLIRSTKQLGDTLTHSLNIHGQSRRGLGQAPIKFPTSVAQAHRQGNIFTFARLILLWPKEGSGFDSSQPRPNIFNDFIS